MESVDIDKPSIEQLYPECAKIIGVYENVANFATMEHAWKLIEKIKETGTWSIKLSNKGTDNYWWCYLMSVDTDEEYISQGSTAEEAICRSALKMEKTQNVRR